LWKYKITEIDTVVSRIKQDDDIHHLHKEGFDNLLDGFNEFITENDVTYDNGFGYFNIYSTVAVESTDIIRTARSFYGNDWFSDIVVSSEETMWYEKVYFDLYKLIFFHKLSNVINLILGTSTIRIFSTRLTTANKSCFSAMVR
jgi:hypothetical protein